VEVYGDRLLQFGDPPGRLQPEYGPGLGLRVKVIDELTQARLQADFLDALRAQADERVAQGIHHALLRLRDGTRVLGDVGPVRGGPTLDQRSERRGCGERLAELVVQIACKRATLLLLHLEQTISQPQA